MNLDFVQTNAADILNTILTTLENGCGEPLYPGDERRLFGEAGLAPIFVTFFNAVNDGCRQKPSCERSATKAEFPSVGRELL